jgi:uncharacterized protein involved in exopolysaccharide biosynthesis
MEEMEEIDLIDILKVIYKRRKILFLITFLGLLFGCLFYLLSFFFDLFPKEVSTILEIGHMEDFVPESPLQLAEKIKNDNYGEAIRTKLGILPQEYPDAKRAWKVEAPKDTRLVVIKIKTKNPKQAKAILDELNQIVIKEHQEKFNLQKNVLVDDKKRIEEKIKTLESERKILEDKVNYLISLQAKEPSLINQTLLTEARKELEAKKQDIQDQYLALNDLLRKLEDYEPTKIIKEPSLPPKPAFSSNQMVLNGIIGLILGGFLGIFWIFLLEFWEKNKERFLKP